MKWFNKGPGETDATPAATITAAINGQVVSWSNNCAGVPAPSKNFESAFVSSIHEAAKVLVAGVLVVF